MMWSCERGEELGWKGRDEIARTETVMEWERGIMGDMVKIKVGFP